ncbi:MAG: hypothetical protein KTR25_19770 [Myxococcales bacterium]|nr:hypothetical protein [Myxococcales bacterium]
MLDFLLENFRVVLLSSVVVTVIVSRIHRTVGSALGLVMIGGLGVLGTLIYARDGSVGLGSTPVSQPVFYGICIILAVFNLTALRISLARQHLLHPSQRASNTPNPDL